MKSKRVFPRSSQHFNVIRDAVEEASHVLLANYGKLSRGQIKTKAANDFVTVVDRKMQQVIVECLRKKYPTYGFKAEEDNLTEYAERMWVIDPLDGTSNYIHQIPVFCTSIGLEEAGRPVLGVVYDPMQKEWFRGSLGGGAYVNRRRIYVSKTRELSKAFLASGFPFRCKNRFEPYHESFRKLFYGTRGIRRLGAAALDLCYTASGRFDAFCS